MAATSYMMQLRSDNGPNIFTESLTPGEAEQTQFYETLNFNLLPGNQFIFHAAFHVTTLLGTFVRIRFYATTGSFDIISSPGALLLATLPDVISTGSFHIQSSPISKPTGSFSGSLRLVTSIEVDGTPYSFIVGPQFHLEIIP